MIYCANLNLPIKSDRIAALTGMINKPGLISKLFDVTFPQEYSKASQLLSYALGMVNTVAGRGAVNPTLERVKAAIHQELLVLDISNESNSKRYLYNPYKYCLRDTQACGKQFDNRW